MAARVELVHIILTVGAPQIVAPCHSGRMQVSVSSIDLNLQGVSKSDNKSSNYHVDDQERTQDGNLMLHRAH